MSASAHNAIQKPNAMMMAMQDVYGLLLEQSAQNLAHASTVGFKSFCVRLKEVSRENLEGEKLSYVGVDAILRNHTNGTIGFTKNPYDFAISGKGFFAVQVGDSIRYTRNGQFRRNAMGYLTDSQGNQVLNSENSPIQIISKNPPVVSSHGKITVNGRSIGSIGIFAISPDNLQASGYNLYSLIDPEQKPIPSGGHTLTQGAIEESNVSPMEEAINLINIQRKFEYAQKLMDEYDQQQRKVNQINPRNA